MEPIDMLQWIGAVLGVTGAWLVAHQLGRVRAWGFVGFLASNVCWISWGLSTGAWGLVVMQAAFCLTSLRGVLVSRRAPGGH